MHTNHYDSCNIHYNSDFSGNLIIAEKNKTDSVELSYEILSFVANVCTNKQPIQSLTATITIDGIDIKTGFFGEDVYFKNDEYYIFISKEDIVKFNQFVQSKWPRNDFTSNDE